MSLNSQELFNLFYLLKIPAIAPNLNMVNQSLDRISRLFGDGTTGMDGLDGVRNILAQYTKIQTEISSDPRSMALTRADDVEWGGQPVNRIYANRLSSLRLDLMTVLGLKWLSNDGGNTINTGNNCGGGTSGYYNPVGFN